MAFTSVVVTKGRISVSQGQCVMMAKASAPQEIKNNTHIKPLYLFSEAMIFCFACCKFKGSLLQKLKYQKKSDLF